MHAAKLTLYAMLIAVVANTIFGVAIALYLARRRGRLATILGAFIDLPLALSPVVVGLALVLVFANTGWFGTWLADHGFQVMFAFPSIAIATAFVSLPFVARELIPVLREIGEEQQQAAATLGATSMQTFWRITLPAIRPALTYGIVLTAARALGEYGAVAVVSGAIVRPDRDAHARRPARLEQLRPDRRLRHVAVPGAMAVIVADRPQSRETGA